MDFKSIKTFEDACTDQGIDAKVLPDVSALPEGMQKFLTAAFKLSVINVSLNKDTKGSPTKANWSNSDEYKYLPWFKVKASKKNPSGSGLSFSDFGCVSSGTRVASRLTCRSSEIAKYFGEQFIDLWEDYILHKD